MRNEITFHKIKDRTVTKLRGGRDSIKFKDKNQYTRKTKHKGLKE